MKADQSQSSARLTLSESESLALFELLEDKGLTEFRRATPDLERVFDKLDAIKAAFESRHAKK